jgi:hypothetical protein
MVADVGMLRAMYISVLVFELDLNERS